MGSCCAGSTCGGPATPVVDHEIVDTDPQPVVTEGWDMTGAVNWQGIEGTPRLRRKNNCDWRPGDLTNGIGWIRIQTAGDEPGTAVVTVAGADPAQVHAAWHRLVGLVSGDVRSWFGEDEPY